MKQLLTFKKQCLIGRLFNIPQQCNSYLFLSLFYLYNVFIRLINEQRCHCQNYYIACINSKEYFSCKALLGSKNNYLLLRYYFVLF